LSHASAYAELSPEELRRRLGEAEETLRAIRDGEADAFVVRGPAADRVFALGGDESYRSIMEAMDIGAVALDEGGAVLYANAAMCQLLGCTAAELQAAGLLSYLDAESGGTIQQLIDRAGAGHQRRQLGLTLGDSLRHMAITAGQLPLGFGAGSVLTFTDETARLAAERASESARIARAVISSANEAVVVCDRTGRIINANAAAAALADGDPLGRRFTEALPLTFPLGSAVIHADDLVTLAVEGSSIQGLDAQSEHTDPPRDLLISAAPLRIAANRIGGCVITLVDNSERKAIEKRQGLLLRELDHRVKNSLAVVMSIASRTIANAADLADFRVRFNSRLQALAATHVLLAESAWNGLMVSSVVRRELAPFIASAGPRVVASGLDREVSPDIGIAFALVIHELTTNAVKYGALSAETGLVTITGEAAGEGLARIRWTETGGPAVQPPTTHGFGQTLISRSLNRGNGGSTSVEFTPDGVICEMVLPVR